MPSTSENRVRSIRFVQNRRVFYAAVFPASELIPFCTVDIWSADDRPEEVGYQRAPAPARVREVARYIESEDAILPVGGLLNARGGNGSRYGEVLRFEPDDGPTSEITSGWLTIPPGALPLYVVDMQHRLGGLQQAVFDEGREDLADFPVVVTIADGLSKLEEVEQFELINTTQKKVRTDLARRLMAIQSQDAERRKAIDERGRLWEARGPLVADWLNRHGTWWVGRIIPPNKSKRETPAGIIRETSFVTSLKPILQMPLFQRMADDQVSDVLNRYWSALCGYFPEAFARPNDHVIQKTPGVFSLHMLFPEVAEIARSNSGDMSLESLASAMKSWGDLDSDFWDRDNEEGAGRYGNMKGFARLAAELRHLLPTLDIDI